MKDIAELAKKRNSTVATLILPDESLQYKHLLMLQTCVGDKKCDSMDLIIHCTGGDINVAYQIVDLLRMHCIRLTAIIPYFATSAATLLCLGADRIVIDELAHLGPLDTQIWETVEGGNKAYVSALNPFKTLEELQKFSLKTLEQAVLLIMGRSGLSVNDSVKHAINFVSIVVEPLLQALNVQKLGEYNRALSVGKEYADRIVEQYLPFEPKVRQRLIEKLVYGYPSHDYIINYRELKTLGLDVILPTPDEKKIIDKIMTEAFEGKQSLIRLEEPPKPPPPTTTEKSDTTKQQG